MNAAALPNTDETMEHTRLQFLAHVTGLGAACAALLGGAAQGFSATEAQAGKEGQAVMVKKMLVLGNSISKHGPSKKLEWTGNWGMAASSEDTDYLHLLYAKLCAAQSSKPELIVSGAGGGTLAGQLADISTITTHAADLVIIQLGENDRTVTLDGFQKPYEKLIAAVRSANPAARVYCCGCWGKNPMKSQLVRNACRSQGAVFVDISAVSGDPACSAGSENRFANAGVNWHPGDKGMQGYADAIWNAIRENPTMPAPTQTPVPVPATASAAEGRSETGPARLRGFTVDRMTPETLHKAAEQWHANSVRFMMRPSYRARSLYHTDVQTAWKRMVDELPAQLDLAKELKLAVVLCLFDVPNPRSSDYPKGKERLTAFWNDETNLEGLIGCWRQIAEICRDREQDIWFEILNEPLDWKDFPAPPKPWPRWAQATIDAIRQIDRRHPVVIEAGPGGLCWAFKEFTPLKGEPIVYATHNYQPHVYTHQGIGEISATDLQKAYIETNLGWPGTYGDNGGGLWDKERLRKELEPLIDFQKRHNVRVYISEFGVVKWAPDAARYLRDSLEVYESLGWDWSFHALDENPLWSLEYSDAFEDPRQAKRMTTPGPRADVLREYLNRNLSPEAVEVDIAEIHGVGGAGKETP